MWSPPSQLTCNYLYTNPAPGIILFVFAYFSFAPYLILWGKGEDGTEGKEKRRKHTPNFFSSLKGKEHANFSMGVWLLTLLP